MLQEHKQRTINQSLVSDETMLILVRTKRKMSANGAKPANGGSSSSSSKPILISIVSSMIILLANSRAANSSSNDGLQNHLSEYNSHISSSSLGEPVFRLEPPNRLNFPSSRGATLVCLASGSPKPTISWYSSPIGFGDGPLSQLQVLSSSSSSQQQQQSTSATIQEEQQSQQQSKPVTNVTNLREVLQNGQAIRFYPFKWEQFKPEIHLAEYRCVASNAIATIHSQSALVQARVSTETSEDEAELEQQQQEGEQVADKQEQNQRPLLRVSDEFVQLNSPVVLKCKFIQSSNEQQQRQKQQFDRVNGESWQQQQDDWQQIEWFTSDGLSIAPSSNWMDTNKNLADYFGGQATTGTTKVNLRQLIMRNVDLPETIHCLLTNCASDSLARCKAHPVPIPIQAQFNLNTIQQQQQQSQHITRTGASSKFVAFRSGELHLDSVEMIDLRRTYGCRVRDLSSKRVVARSTGTAQLILTTPPNEQPAQLDHQKLAAASLQPPLVLHSVDQLVALDSDYQSGSSFDASSSSPSAINFKSSSASISLHQKSGRFLLLPCAIRLPHSQLAAGRWFVSPSTRKQHNDQSVVELEEWAARNSIPYSSWTKKTEQQPPFNWTKSDSMIQAATHHSSGRFRRPKETTPSSKPPTKLYVLPTFLAIEWPRWPMSGKFKFQLPIETTTTEWKTVCDINVIIRQPIKLRMSAKLSGGGGFSESNSGQVLALKSLGDQTKQGGGTSWLREWFHLRTKRQSSMMPGLGKSELDEMEDRSPATDEDAGDGDEDDDGHNPLIDDYSRRIQVRAAPQEDDREAESLHHNQHRHRARHPRREQLRGRRLVKLPQVKLAQLGDRLELSCHISTGFPIQSIRWFKNGQLIQPHSSAGDYFQYEITDQYHQQEPSRTLQDEERENEHRQKAAAKSRLLIKQLQPNELGPQMFECFGQNYQADRARAEQLVFVLDAKLLAEVRRRMEQISGGQCDAAATVNQTMSELGDDDNDEQSFLTNRGAQIRHSDQLLDNFLADQAAADRQSLSVAQLLFKLRNPVETEYLVESEQVELVCPQPAAEQLGGGGGMISAVGSSARTMDDSSLGQEQTSNKKAQSFEWFKWSFAPQTSPTTTTKQQTNSNVATTNNNKLVATQSNLGAGHFNQLFGSSGGGGDSRLVINGSSLQIKALAKNYDEAVYVCRQNYADSRALADGIEQAAGEHRQPTTNELQLLPFGSNNNNNNNNNEDAAAASVHQSSLATTTTLAANSNNNKRRQSGGSSFALPSSSCQMNSIERQVSSIRIKIVSKPKIDPFEFSRNLEEGMRSVVVCAVISGQSPIEINWFKDGELLLLPSNMEMDKSNPADLSVDQSNGFSSTLTFHRIHPSHSGFYTCVASNSFASTNHTSRLLVNVAPYFIEPPKSQRAYLNSNILINCRAGGQPSPQIRWRKLVPTRNSSSSSSPSSLFVHLKQVAPLGGQATHPNSEQFYSDFAGHQSPNGALNQQQMAAAQQPTKYEFKIITSNSHIQVLENGSMIIKDVELGDQSRYACQAINGINPSLSEVIDLQVLSPAQFEVNYETISVKRDSMIKFNCLPRGDQPIRLQWFKEGNQLLSAEQQQHSSNSSSNIALTANELEQLRQTSRYSEVVHFYRLNQAQRSTASNNYSTLINEQQQQQRRNNLILTNGNSPSLQLNRQQQRWKIKTPDEQKQFELAASPPPSAVVSSELIINYADRGDSGTFTCLAENAFGRDELTYKLIVQEQPDSPIQIGIDQIQASQLRLSWSNGFDGNLPILSYVIEFRRLSSQSSSGSQAATTSASRLSAAAEQQQQVGANNEWSRLIVGSSQAITQQTATAATTTSDYDSSSAARKQQQRLSVLLKQLQAKSFYQIRLAATNSMGQSEFSSIQTIQTAEEPPNQRPNDLRVQPISSSSIKVMWRSPILVDEQAPIRGYYVSYRQLADTTLNSKAEVEQQKASQANSGNKTSSTSSAWISLSSAASTSQNTSSMMVDLMQTNNNNNYEFLLDQLGKNTKYEVRVQPFNSQGVGPAGETIGQTLKFDRPKQPQLRLIAARKQSFELKWSFSQQQQQEEQQHLMGFSLFYKCEYDDWQEIQLAIIYSYKIDNLRCGNKYQIYLSAFNVVGRSDPSDVLNVRTEGTVPSAPDKASLIARLNQTEVQLDLSGWQSGGCPISVFMIQYKRVHDSNWFVLSEGSQSFVQSSQDRVLIADLMPATWYKLLVTATNEAGNTNAEYLFGTLTAGGEPLRPTAEIESYLLNGGQQQQPTRSSGDLVSYNREQLSGLGGSAILRSLSQLFGGGGGGNNQDQARLLLPLSCVLLLLVTSLASYLYYSRMTAANTGHGSSRIVGGHHQANLANQKKQKKMAANNGKEYIGNARQQQATTNLLMMDKLNLISNQETMNQMQCMMNEGGRQTLNCHHHHHHHLNGSPNCASGSATTATTTTTTNESDSGASSEISGHSAAAAMNNNNNLIGYQNHDNSSSPFQQQQQQQQYLTYANNSLVTDSMIDSLIEQQQQQQQPSDIDQMGTISQLADGNIVYQPPPPSSTMNAMTLSRAQNARMNNLQAPPANSSSISTQSTSCFEGHSGSSSSVLGHHVQLTSSSIEPHQANDIESSFMATTSATATTPHHHLVYSPAHYHKNVELIVNQPADHHQLYATTTTTTAATAGNSSHQAAAHRLISSNSFASAADLLQRQQQLLLLAAQNNNVDDADNNRFSQQTNNEPIYQRLDRFKQLCNGSTCAKQQQFATLNPSSKAHLIRQYSNQFHHQQQSFAAPAQPVADHSQHGTGFVNFDRQMPAANQSLGRFLNSRQHSVDAAGATNAATTDQSQFGEMMANNDGDLAKSLFYAAPPPPLND